MYALLGVNGAGKTTTIRMLTGLTKPTAGEAYVMGRSISDELDEVKRLVNISPQETSVAPNLTVRENLEFIAGIYGFDKAKTVERVREMLAQFSMEEVEHQKAKTLSGGWQRKLNIAMALITEPKVLFLDEPTLGIDVLARRELWRKIEALKGKITIVLTTHYMDEAEELCDRVAIIDHGRLVRTGSPGELCESIGEWAVEYRSEGRKHYRYFSDREESRRFLDSLPPDSQTVSRSTNLEDVFLELTGRDTVATEEVSYKI